MADGRILSQARIVGLIVGLLFVHLHSPPAVCAEERSGTKKGLVRVSSATASPTILRYSGPTCTTATVQVAVVRGGLPDNPAVTVSLSEFYSDPPELTVEILPKWRQATITDDIGRFSFEVCVPKEREKLLTGKITVQAVITDWSPKDKFDRESEEDNYELASIAIEK